MFSTAQPSSLRFAGMLALLPMLLVTGCDRSHLSLPVAQAAAQTGEPAEMLTRPKVVPDPRRVSLRHPDETFERVTEQLNREFPSQSCYAFMLRRPRTQRAEAVQARLRQADQMSAALDSNTFNVGLTGDHANVLSLEFPVTWPAAPAYSQRVSAVIVDYLSVPDIQDYLCNSGFSEVRLSAHGMNDNRSHLLWTAQVTSEGLLKKTPDGRRERIDEAGSKP